MTNFYKLLDDLLTILEICSSICISIYYIPASSFKIDIPNTATFIMKST